MTRSPETNSILSALIAAAIILAFVDRAAADDATKRGGPSPEAATLAATVPDAAQAPEPAAGASATTTAPAAGEQVEAPRYPRAVIARPLTLPQGLAMLGADATANHDFSAMGGA